MRNMLNKLLS